MLTSTDIPPGGEGQIEVTFDSSHKKGQQKKTVTVESNDPRRPTASLNISALVEVVFGWDQYNLDLGKFRRGQPVTMTTSMVVKDPSTSKNVTFLSSSPYISAALARTPATSDSEGSHLTVEVSAAPEIPVGRFNATLTARAGDRTSLDAALPIVANVIGNTDISPDAVQFHVDTTKADAKPVKQVIKVMSVIDAAQVHLLDVKDVEQRMAIHVDTLVAGKQYEISVTPQPSVILARQNVVGSITVTTDDKDQPTTLVNYFISFGQ